MATLTRKSFSKAVRKIPAVQNTSMYIAKSGNIYKNTPKKVGQLIRK